LSNYHRIVAKVFPETRDTDSASGDWSVSEIIGDEGGKILRLNGSQGPDHYFWTQNNGMAYSLHYTGQSPDVVKDIVSETLNASDHSSR
jgi:hypothetical protein